MRYRVRGKMPDGTRRLRWRGEAVHHFTCVSSWAEMAVVPEAGVLRISEEVPLTVAALLGCAVTTGVGAVVNTARVKPGSSVAVFGAGGVGLNVVQGAALAGASTIIAVDLLDNKLDLARQFGATHTILASRGEPAEQVRALTGGRGVDYAFEVVGLPKTVRQAYDSLAKRGMAVVVGVSPTTAEVSVPLLSMVFEERVLTGSMYGSAVPRIDILKLIEL